MHAHCQALGKAPAKKAKPAGAVLGASSAVNVGPHAAGQHGKAIEEIYQKKSQLEHILLRPDTYIGSTEKQAQQLWVHDGERMVMQNVSIVPGLYKIFDEILVNAADNKVRDPTMDTVRVTIDEVRRAGAQRGAVRDAPPACPGTQARAHSCAQASNSITVWNNGHGVPVDIHKEEKVYVPELIFGHLLTSSNYDDDEKKVSTSVGGSWTARTVRPAPFKHAAMHTSMPPPSAADHGRPQRLRRQAGQHLLHRVHH